MKSFEEQLKDFLAAHNLPELIKHRSDGWTHFLHLYGQVVEDCPLIAKGRGFDNISQVTVHLELAKTIKPDEGEEMMFKVRWTVHDKNGQSGDIEIYNSFSLH